MALAGKTVRCRACRFSFEIPDPETKPAVSDNGVTLNLRDESDDALPAVGGPSLDDTPVAPLPAITESTATESPSDALPVVKASRRSTGKPDVNKSAKAKRTPESAASPAYATDDAALLPAEMFTAAEATGDVQVFHRPGWFTHPVVTAVDKWAPGAIVVLGYLWLAISVAGVSPSTPGWIWLSRFGLIVALYSVLVAPLALLGVKIAMNIAGRPTPKGNVLRIYTAYIPAMVLAVVLWNVGGGATPALVMGTALGLFVSAGAILLFFRLKPEETLPVAALGSGGFVLGSALATLVALGLNYLTIAGLRESKTTTPPPASPFLPWIAWDVQPPPDEPPSKPVKPAPAPAPIPGPVPVPVPVPAHPSTPPASESAPSPTGPSNRVTPTPSVPQRSTPEPEPPAPIMAVPNDGATTPRHVAPAASGPLTESPLVASVTPIPTGGAFDAVLRPLAVSDLLIATRRPEPATLQMDVYSLGQSGARFTARFMDAPAAGRPEQTVHESNAISAAPALLARSATFPRPCIQIWSFEQKQVVHTIEVALEKGEALPVLVGFAKPERLVYYVPNRNKLYTIDLGGTVKATDLPIGLTAENCLFTIDPTGTTVVVALLGPADARTKLAAGHHLFIVNLDNPTVAPRRVAVTKVASDFAVAPTGMAFTPDGLRVSVYFERGGSAVLLTYDVATGEFADREAVFPASAARPPLERRFAGSSISYLADGRHLLVYGNGVVSAEGKVVGAIDIPRVTAATVREDGSLVLVQEPEGAPRTVLAVKLVQNALDPTPPRGDTRGSPGR